MSRKVLLHVGTPKTGTSYLQDVLFRNRETLARRRHPLPRRPARRPLPGRARPDEAALGRAPGRGDRRVGRAGRQVRERRRAPRSSATRSSRPPRARRSAGPWSRSGTAPAPRCTSCSRCATWSARSPRSGRRTSSTAPRSATATSSTRSATRSGRAGSAPWFWGVQEIPDILDRWGQDLPPRARPPGHRAAARWRARAAVEAVQPGLRPRRDRPRPRGRAGTTPRSAYPRPTLLRRINRRANADAAHRPTTGRWSASCWPTRPCPGAPARRGWRCRRTLHPWVAGAVARRGSPRSSGAGTTWSATSTTWSARRR